MNPAVPLIYTYILYYLGRRQIDIDKGQPNEKQLYIKTCIYIDIYRYIGRFLKVAMAKLYFIKRAYNHEFAPEFSVSILKESIALVRDYVYEIRK